MRVVVPLPRQMSELTGALRSHRTGTMVQAMLLGGLRRREVLGLRLCDVDPGEKPPGRDLGGSHEHRCSHGRAICHRFVGIRPDVVRTSGYVALLAGMGLLGSVHDRAAFDCLPGEEGPGGRLAAHALTESGN
jgi:hypothetical protein